MVVAAFPQHILRALVAPPPQASCDDLRADAARLRAEVARLEAALSAQAGRFNQELELCRSAADEQAAHSCVSSQTALAELRRERDLARAEAAAKDSRLDELRASVHRLRSRLAIAKAAKQRIVAASELAAVEITEKALHAFRQRDALAATVRTLSGELERQLDCDAAAASAASAAAAPPASLGAALARAAHRSLTPQQRRQPGVLLPSEEEEEEGAACAPSLLHDAAALRVQELSSDAAAPRAHTSSPAAMLAVQGAARAAAQAAAEGDADVVERLAHLHALISSSAEEASAKNAALVSAEDKLGVAEQARVEAERALATALAGKSDAVREAEEVKRAMERMKADFGAACAHNERLKAELRDAAAEVTAASTLHSASAAAESAAHHGDIEERAALQRSATARVGQGPFPAQAGFVFWGAAPA